MSALDQQYLMRREVEWQLARMQYDEHGTPSTKMPDCPVCGEDELGATSRYGSCVHVVCYRCRFTFDFESLLERKP